MKKLLVVLVLIAAVVSTGAAQVGLGVSAGYSAGFALNSYGYGYGDVVPPPLFLGATLRYRPSAVMIDCGVSYWSEYATLIYGYLNIGLSLDLWIFRVELSGGADVVNFSSPWLFFETGMSDYSAVGFDGKLGLNVEVGDVSVGLSLTVPLDMVANAFLYNLEWGTPNFTFRAFVVQASLNVVYWFGSSSRIR